MVLCSCSLIAWYLLTAIVSYVVAHIIQVVLGKHHPVKSRSIDRPDSATKDRPIAVPLKALFEFRSIITIMR
uniref:Putative secreted protein n=1 Tax=Anopheles darlingi TaxID=43151 RepID=A0A2M4DPS5_ANODA